MGVQSAVFEIIHESLKDKSKSLTVVALCEIAGVSTSGYYNWVNSQANRDKKEAKDREDFELILEAYHFRGYKKGVLSINMRLLHMGIVMNPKKIRRLILFCDIYPSSRFFSARLVCDAYRYSKLASLGGCEDQKNVVYKPDRSSLTFPARNGIVVAAVRIAWERTALNREAYFCFSEFRQAR